MPLLPLLPLPCDHRLAVATTLTPSRVAYGWMPACLPALQRCGEMKHALRLLQSQAQLVAATPHDRVRGLPDLLRNAGLPLTVVAPPLPSLPPPTALGKGGTHPAASPQTLCGPPQRRQVPRVLCRVRPRHPGHSSCAPPMVYARPALTLPLPSCPRPAAPPSSPHPFPASRSVKDVARLNSQPTGGTVRVAGHAERALRAPPHRHRVITAAVPLLTCARQATTRGQSHPFSPSFVLRTMREALRQQAVMLPGDSMTLPMTQVRVTLAAPCLTTSGGCGSRVLPRM